MLKDILFMLVLFTMTLFFGIYVITNNIERKERKPEQIHRTVEMIDPNYDKKVGR